MYLLPCAGGIILLLLLCNRVFRLRGLATHSDTRTPSASGGVFLYLQPSVGGCGNISNTTTIYQIVANLQPPFSKMAVFHSSERKKEVRNEKSINNVLLCWFGGDGSW